MSSLYVFGCVLEIASNYMILKLLWRTHSPPDKKTPAARGRFAIAHPGVSGRYTSLRTRAAVSACDCLTGERHHRAHSLAACRRNTWHTRWLIHRVCVTTCSRDRPGVSVERPYDHTQPKTGPPVQILEPAAFSPARNTSCNYWSQESSYGTTLLRDLMKSILDHSFRYTKSIDTDLRKTFARIRRELRQQTQGQDKGDDPGKVFPIRQRKHA